MFTERLTPFCSPEPQSQLHNFAKLYMRYQLLWLWCYPLDFYYDTTMTPVLYTIHVVRQRCGNNKEMETTATITHLKVGTARRQHHLVGLQLSALGSQCDVHQALIVQQGREDGDEVRLVIVPT